MSRSNFVEQGGALLLHYLRGASAVLQPRSLASDTLLQAAQRDLLLGV